MSYIVYIGIGGYLAKNTVGIEQRNTVKLVPKENLWLAVNACRANGIKARSGLLNKLVSFRSLGSWLRGMFISSKLSFSPVVVVREYRSAEPHWYYGRPRDFAEIFERRTCLNIRGIALFAYRSWAVESWNFEIPVLYEMYEFSEPNPYVQIIFTMLVSRQLFNTIVYKTCWRKYQRLKKAMN